jgi:hypothetical protein
MFRRRSDIGSQHEFVALEPVDAHPVEVGQAVVQVLHQALEAFLHGQVRRLQSRLRFQNHFGRERVVYHGLLFVFGFRRVF